MSGTAWMVRQIRLYGYHHIREYKVVAYGLQNDYAAYANGNRVYVGSASDVYWYCVKGA